MSDTKIFSFGDQGGSNSMAGLIASLCQNRGLDPNMVMAMMNNGRGNGGWGGEGGWFMWVIFLFFLMGWGGNGFGGFGNRGGLSQGAADLAGLINNDNGRDLLMQAINGNGNAIGQLATTLNCDVNAIQGTLNTMQQSLCNIGSQIGMTGQQIINAIQAGDCDITSKIASCCCDLKNLVTTQGYENQLRTVQQTDDIKSDATAKFNVLSAKIDAQTQIINDKFCQLEMREMQRENQNLRDQLQAYQLSASQQTQTANIVSQLKPCPTPAYIVPNPFGCGCRDGYPYGGNCGNNGCGC